MKDIKPGNYVQHKMGGPTMVVACYAKRRTGGIGLDIDDSRRVQCEWIVDSMLKREIFYVNTLRLKEKATDEETKAAIEIIIQIFIDFNNVKRKHDNRPEMTEQEEESWRTRLRDSFLAMRKAVSPADVVRVIKLISDTGGFLL